MNLNGLKSKKLIGAVSSVIGLVAADVFGLNLNMETIIGVVGIVLGYLGAQGWADQGKEAEKIKLQK